MARKRKKSRVGLIISLLLLLIVAATAAWYVLAPKEDIIFVSVEPVAKRTIIQTVNAIGKVQPEFMVNISSEASGEIVYLGVRDGDTVRSGDQLVRILPDIVETQLEQTRASVEASRMSITIAKAERDRTEADLKRITELYKKDYATREEMDRTKAAFESAAARFSQTKAEYSRTQGALKQSIATASRTTITSPMSGVVTYLAVERGEKVVCTAQMQGTEIMRIADLSIMNAWVDVDENDVALIAVGDTARIRIDALQDQIFIGIVYEISHSPKTSGVGTQEEVVNYEVRIRFENIDNKMRPGMSVSVDIETEIKDSVVAIPIQAVTVDRNNLVKAEDDDWRIKDKKKGSIAKVTRPQSIVWVSSGSSVTARGVETGISDQGFIEITGGLKPGEEVVVGPYQAVSKLLGPDSKIKIEDKADRIKRFDKMRQE